MTDTTVFPTVELMLAKASHREEMEKNRDSLSGSAFERVVIDGEPYVLKYLGYQIDWLARALGDRDCFARTMWQRGLLGQLPADIDHTIAAVADDPGTGRVALLLRDVGPHLVPHGNERIGQEQHRTFLDHMARMHAAFWEFPDGSGLLPPGNRYIALTPGTGMREAVTASADPVPRMLVARWAALAEAAPQLHAYAARIAHDPAPLVSVLERMPATLVHGDWKLGNLGSHPDGRTILLDWGWPGRAAPLVDLGWYLAVNCDRIPESKEDTIAAYRNSLERLGIHTEPWWHEQLGVALLGAFVQLGWSKTRDAAELEWWERQVTPVARKLLEA